MSAFTIHNLPDGGRLQAIEDQSNALDGWDQITATYLVPGSVAEARARFPLMAEYQPGGGNFYALSRRVMPSRLPGLAKVELSLAGIYARKHSVAGGVQARSEKLSNVYLPGWENWGATNPIYSNVEMLVADPTVEETIVDATPPEFAKCGKTVYQTIGGKSFQQLGGMIGVLGSNPSLNLTVRGGFSYYDGLARLNLPWRAGLPGGDAWVLAGMSWEQLGALYAKRYQYVWRPKFGDSGA